MKKKTSKVAAHALSEVRQKAAKKKSPVPFISTGFWLVKSEPDAYSIAQLAHDKKTLWTGVRNYQARNFMTTSMKPGDHVLFYHSNADVTGVAGLAEITRVNLPDPSALDPDNEYYDPKSSDDHPIWFCAEIGFKYKFTQVVTLESIRAHSELAKMPLLARGQRLSVQPVSRDEYQTIVEMGRA